ncbi:DUF3450 domain-containing protein [bacterium]|nr:DUF3450 domain-containing protein [bacterium]
MNRFFSISLLLGGTIIASTLIPRFAIRADDFVDRVRKPVQQSITIRQKTQKTREQWEAEKASLTERLQALEAENRRLQEAQQSLKKQIETSRQKTAHDTQQIENSLHLSREMGPYLETVYQKLADQIATDHPFLENERRKRLQTLRLLLDDPDASISEKYRRLMEALFIEAEYGSTVEIYQETIQSEGQALTANILRLGRISLFFQSPDKNRTGYFDPHARIWKPFPASTNREINTAFEIAARRRPAKIVNLPLGRLVIP